MNGEKTYALVTGATGGLGKAFACALAKRGGRYGQTQRIDVGVFRSPFYLGLHFRFQRIYSESV